MAEADGTDMRNGVVVVVTDGDETECQNSDDTGRGTHHRRKEEESLYGVLRGLTSAIFFPDEEHGRAPLLHRIKASVAENAPRLREASGNTGRHVLNWTRRGSPLRALLVISVSVSLTCTFVLLQLVPIVLQLVCFHTISVPNKVSIFWEFDYIFEWVLLELRHVCFLSV